MERDCHNCTRTKEDDSCPLPSRDIDTCLHNPSRPFWQGKESHAGTVHKDGMSDQEKLADFLGKQKIEKNWDHKCNCQCPECRPDKQQPMYVPSDDPYFELNLVLRNARDQASQGKGKERHANDNNYEDQVICVVGRLLKDHPFGAHAYQVIKKTIEAGRLYKIAGPEAAYNEMLGAINYAAAMNILIKEKD